MKTVRSWRSQHRKTQTYGVQFHPESLLTGDGKRMLANFLNLIPGVSVERPPIVEDRPKTELKKYIAKVADGCDLTLEEAQDAMDIIMSGSATNAQIAGLLVALRMKGETIDEITGFAKGMRNKAKHVTGCEESIEIVGTGGDLANSFNISHHFLFRNFRCRNAGGKARQPQRFQQEWCGRRAGKAWV